MTTYTAYKPGITVAICTYNRSRYLADTLHYLAMQTTVQGDYEILVVNNNSTDATDEVLRQWPDVRAVREDSQGLSYARNRALREARFTHTLFIDDDVILPSDFLWAWQAFLTDHPDVCLAGAPIYVHFDDGKPSWFPMILAQMLGRHKARPEGYQYPAGSYPHGGNMLLNTQIALKAGGFNTGIGRTGAVLSAGEEKDFFLRLQRGGTQIMHNPNAVLGHRVGNERLTHEYVYRQARGIGHGDALVTHGMAAVWKWHLKQGLKWAVSLVVSAGYLAGLRAGCALTVLRFRIEVLRGFLQARQSSS